jgi:competence protein ComEC
MLLIYLSCVWVIGIWLGYYLSLPPALSLIGIIPLIILFFIRNYRKQLALSGLGIIILVIANGYSFMRLYNIDETDIHFYNNLGETEIKGMVSEEPDVRDNSIRLTLASVAINIENGWKEVEGKVLVIVPRYPVYSYGDYLQVKGELETPPQLGDFDYRGYLANQGIYSTIYYPYIDVLDTGKGIKPLGWVYALRSALTEVLAEALPEPQAALAQGIVLGIRSNIPAGLQDDFAVSGTTHLLAISGMNIGIMAGVLLGIGLWIFKRRYYLYVWLTLGAVWFYVLITGVNPPVVRGAIMASIFLLAEALGRQRSAVVALSLAAAVMVGFSPCVLGDASFQLSFLAMAGLVFIYPVLRDYGKNLVSSRLGEEGALVSLAGVIIDTWSATLAATVAVWPLIAYYFGFISLIGPLATFLALPALPLIIVFGALMGVIGLISIVAAQVVGWLAWLFLSYLILVVSSTASLSLSSVQIGQIHPALIGGYYLLLAGLIYLHNRWRKSRNPVSGVAGRMKEGINISFGLSRKTKWFIVPLLLVTVLVFYTAATIPGNELKVSFLDVGEGDAILIQQGNQQVVVDGGPSPRAIAQELGRQMPFWDRTIDLLVLTHPHQDHLAGLVEVMRRYKVKQVLYPAIEYDSPMYDEWLRLIEEKGVKSVTACAGQRIDFGDRITIKVLNPPAALLSGTESDIDNNSIVLHLSAGSVNFILTGDIMREAEWALIRDRTEIAGAVVKVPHHGSDTSSTAGFLTVVNARAAVISCGVDNKFGHPKSEILTRLGKVVGVGNIYRTDRNSTISFTTDGERLWVKTSK